MFAHFRPNEFLTLKFDAKELVIGYNLLQTLYTKNPTPDLAKMIKAMEDKLFPKPKLVLVGTFHLCHKCYQEINTTIDRYQIRTSEQGDISWIHLECPALKPDSERER